MTYQLHHWTQRLTCYLSFLFYQWTYLLLLNVPFRTTASMIVLSGFQGRRKQWMITLITFIPSQLTFSHVSIIKAKQGIKAILQVSQKTLDLIASSKYFWNIFGKWQHYVVIFKALLQMLFLSTIMKGQYYLHFTDGKTEPQKCVQCYLVSRQNGVLRCSSSDSESYVLPNIPCCSLRIEHVFCLFFCLPQYPEQCTWQGLFC